jgi:beta-1,4-mannosyltransferase
MAGPLRRSASERIGLARLAMSAGASSGNPYFDLLERHLASYGLPIVPDPPLSLRWLFRARRRVAFLHFQWRPDVYYLWRPPRFLRRRRLRLERFQGVLTWLTLARFCARLLASRAMGYRVAWTIHEVYPPESGRRSPGSVSRRVDRLAARALIGASEVLIAHDEETAEKVKVEFGAPAPRLHVVPHGSYIGVYAPGRPRRVVRAELRIADDAFVFLCFGSLRPEKGIQFLLGAFQELALADAVLVIAGCPEDSASAWSTIRAFRADARIRPILGSVPTARVAELFAAADSAVMPRSETWTSGSLILALSLGVPVVAAKLPAYEELLAGEQAGWLFAPGDPDSLRETLGRAATDPAAARAKGAAALRQAENLPSWDEIARRTATLLLAPEAHGASVIRAGGVLRGSE